MVIICKIVPDRKQMEKNIKREKEKKRFYKGFPCKKLFPREFFVK